MSGKDWQLETIGSVNDISADDWDSCANSLTKPYNPFISHAFLSALENSKSAIAETGWYGQHLVLRDNAKVVQGVVPAFLKSHSRGEYVFDQSWADAFVRAGGNYYPKLQISVPFTPATGPRLLIKDKSKVPAITAALAKGLGALCQRHQLSSAHITFLPQRQANDLEQLGWLTRTDTQFHWLNDGYDCFDDFLLKLSSRKRKNIRKERAGVANNGFRFDMLTGNQITAHHWDMFFQFYQDTGARKWGTPYLTRGFFDEIGQTMGDKILLVMVRDNDRYIAGALNFIGGDTLFGRYWGALEEYPGLHFETCYYRAMEFAIERKLKTVEAGAQGPHKLARGYVPVTTYSSHYITNPGFRSAIEDYLKHEKAYVAQDNVILSKSSPFRKDTSAKKEDK